jgi:hypothetical protein
MRKAVGPPVEALRVAGVVTVDLRLLHSTRLAGLARPEKPRASPGNRSPLGLARYGAELVDLSEADHVRGVESPVRARDETRLRDLVGRDLVGRDLVGIVGRR